MQGEPSEDTARVGGGALRRDLVVVAVLVAAYVVTGRIGLGLAYYQRNATLVWAPAGLSIAALWLFGARFAPAVFVASFVTNYSIGSSLALSLGIAAGNTTEAVVAVALVRRLGIQAGLHSVRDALRFVGSVVVAAPAVSALNGVLWLVVLAGLPISRAPATTAIWWLGNAGGVLVVTSLVLAFARPSPRPAAQRATTRPAARRGTTEALLVALSAVASAGVAFGGLLPASWIDVPVALLPFPALVWAAVRFGLRGATAACAAVTAAAVAGTVAGTSPFHYGNLHVDVAMLWLFLATLSISAMLLAVGVDERAREAAARAEGEQWLQIALGAADAVAFERDLAGGRVRARDAASGGGPEHWVDETTWEASIHPDDMPPYRAALDACVRGDRDAWDVELRVVDGARPPRDREVVPEPRVLLERGRVVARDEDGRALRAFGLQRDVTARRREEEGRRALERELERSKRLSEVGLLAGGVAHDFNNLLTVVRANVEVARAARSPRHLSESLGAIEEAALRGAELTDQLLAYSGRRPMQRRVLDLREVAADTVRMLRASCPARVTLSIDETERGAARVEADPAQVRQVVLNLVLNAIEAIPEDRSGHVRVRVRTARRDDDRLAVLEVEDDGSGIDEATRARLFEPFFTTKPRGRGLGMAAVLGIVRAHGGDIEVASEHGRGTTFRARFPATEAAPQAAAEQAPPERPAAPASAPPTSRKVLVVDDEPAIRSVTRLLLSDAGWDVVLAANADDARTRFDEAGPFDVVLVDLTMPGQSGSELLRTLRSRRPDLPAVVMSGFADALVTGALTGNSGLAQTPFLAKPFRESELLARLDEAIARSHN